APGHRQPAALPGGAHARVRRRAFVVADRAGGVAEDLVAEAGVVEQLAHDVLARRRAADVAHADEEDGGDGGAIVIHRMRKGETAERAACSAASAKGQKQVADEALRV